ncbi:MAG TPA: hypothetical protein VF187_02025, partial [Gemmatimonadales bacterium]
LGFFLGMRHATDPDHVAAVTTLVARQRSARSAAWIGAAWGLGHTVTILAVGSGIILLGWVIPARVGLSLELSVGVMLIVLGLVNLVGAVRGARASVVPTDPDSKAPRIGPGLVRPAIVGLVHGLAGSAAVALLVLTTISNPTWAVFYLLVFGVGTMVGMMLITMAIALPFRAAGHRFERLDRGLRIASGVISLAFGVFLAWEIGVTSGLFGAAPLWTPH